MRAQSDLQNTVRRRPGSRKLFHHEASHSGERSVTSIFQQKSAESVRLGKARGGIEPNGRCGQVQHASAALQLQEFDRRDWLCVCLYPMPLDTAACVYVYLCVTLVFVAPEQVE